MSAKLYPVTQSELRCTDYTVTVDGVAAPLDTARESLVPFNRRWPGYQRSVSQTGLHNFLSLEVSGPVEFAITPTAPFNPDKVVIRPRSLGITPKIEKGVISFTLPRAAYFTVEAYGRQKALHIFADPAAVHTPKAGDLYFGPGEHEAGIIEMQSGQTVFIDAGAVVYGRIHAIDCSDIKIVGRGILDCSRIREKIFFEVHQELTHAGGSCVVRQRRGNQRRALSDDRKDQQRFSRQELIHHRIEDKEEQHGQHAEGSNATVLHDFQHPLPIAAAEDTVTGIGQAVQMEAAGHEDVGHQQNHSGHFRIHPEGQKADQI